MRLRRVINRRRDAIRSALPSQVRRLRLEALEDRRVLDASLGIDLLDHFAYPGETITAEWFISKSLADTNASGAIEAAELSQIQISVDGLGILANQIEFTPTLDENAFIDLYGDLRGVVSMPVPSGVAPGSPVDAWMTVSVAEDVESLGVVEGGVLSASASTGQGTTILSTPSQSQAVTATIVSNAVAGFVAQFGNTINGVPTVDWLDSYVDTLNPSLSQYPGSHDYLLDQLAKQATRNDQATKVATNYQPSLLWRHVPEVLEMAYGGRVISTKSWVPNKPTIILVHGVGNTESSFRGTVEALTLLVPDANVLGLAWGLATPLNGLQRSIPKLLSDADSEPSPLLKLVPFDGDLIYLNALRKFVEARLNLSGAVDLHLLLKILNRAYTQVGRSPSTNIDIVAHSQGTVVTAGALALDPPSESYDIHKVLFIGANLHREATEAAQEFAQIAPQLLSITNFASQYDKTVSKGLESVHGVGAGNLGFTREIPGQQGNTGLQTEEASSLDLLEGIRIVHTRPLLNSGTDHFGDNSEIGWWDWLLRMQRDQRFLDKHFGFLATPTSSSVDISSEAHRVGALPVQMVERPTVIVASSTQFDIPVRGVQVRAPSVPLPTQPIVPPALASVSMTPNLAFRGEWLVVKAIGASAAPGRRIVRFDAYLDLNNNQLIDPGEYLNSDHDAAGGWRIDLPTIEIGLGTNRILVRVADEQNTPSVVRSATVQIVEPGSPPSELPASMSATADSKYQIIPHRNGDVSYDPAHYSVGPGKVDLWEIRPTNGGGFTFETTGDTDTVLGLYNRTTGELLAFDEDNSTEGDNAEIVATLDAGVAYVLAVVSQRGDAGNYGLDVIGVNQILDGTIATPPPLYEGSVAGTVSTLYDTKYFRLDVPAGGTALDLRLHTSATLDGFVRVENFEHETLRTSFLSGAGLDDVISDMLVTPGQILYVTVTGIDGTTGTFTFDVDFNPDDSGLPEELAPVPSSPLLVTLPDGSLSVMDKEISVGGQIDYYFLSTQPGETGQFVIETFGDLDTQVGLYRRFGSHFAEFVAEDDDGGAGLNGRVTTTLLAGEVYVIAVRADGSATGIYDLSISGQPSSVNQLHALGRILSLTTLPDFLANSDKYTHYSVVAPQGATTLDISAEILPGSETLDVGLRIVDAAGSVVAMLDSAGPGVNEQASLPVIAGATYFITVWSEDLAFGNYRLQLDFDPDFEITEGAEFPVNSTAFDDQRSPALAMNAAGLSVATWISRPSDSFDRDIFFQRFDANGSPVGPEAQANSPDATDPGPPTIGIDAVGNFVIALTDNGQVLFRRFSAAGAALAVETLAGLSGASSIDIAMQGNGAFMIVASNSTSLQGRLFDSNGNPITSPLLLDDTADDVEQASVSADGNGNYVIAWNVFSDGFLVSDVYALRVDSSGNAIPSGRHSFVAGEVRGRRFEDSNGNGVQDIGEAGIGGVTVLLDVDGNGLQNGGELTQITDSHGDYVFNGVATGAYRVVQVGGPVSGPAVLVDAFNHSDSSDLGPTWVEQTGDMRVEGNRLRSQAGTDGKSRAVYQSFDSSRQAITFDLDYEAATGERIVNAQAYLAYADPQHYVSVKFQDNSIDGQSQFYRVFFDFTDSKSLTDWPRMRGGPQFVDVAPFSSARILAVYDPISSTLTVGIDRGFDGVYETILTRGGILPDGLGTKVAIGGFNNVAIDNLRVDTNWQVVVPSGAAPTEAFRVAPQQIQSQGPPAVAAHPDGTFVIAFEANDTDGSGRNIYVQRFAADGQQSGPLSRANSLTDGDQTEPTVAIISQGKFLVGWTTVDADTNGVAVQLFDVAGQPVGPEFLINEHQPGIQQRLALASDGDDKYQGAWESNGQDLSGWGIFGRRLTIDALLESELTVIDSSGASEDRFMQFESPGEAGALVALPFAANIQTVVIRNDGNRELTINDLDVYGEHAAYFSLSDDTGFTLLSGEFRELTVEFLGAVQGEYFAALRIFHNDTADALSRQFEANPYWISLLGDVPDVVSPSVARVLVASSTPWTITFLEHLDSPGDVLGGFAVPVGTGEQLRTLPWTNIDQIKIAFSEDVIVSESDLAVLGSNVAEYEFLPDGFSYDPATFVATWTLASVFGPDTLRLVLSSAGITDAAGNALDGEWTDPIALTDVGTHAFPSGNGIVGGDFLFRFNVVPGDVDGNNGVNFGDYLQARALVGKVAGVPGYHSRFDLDGNGGINFGDPLLTRSRIGSVLPTTEPAMPTAPSPSQDLHVIDLEPGEGHGMTNDQVDDKSTLPMSRVPSIYKIDKTADLAHDAALRQSAGEAPHTSSAVVASLAIATADAATLMPKFQHTIVSLVGSGTVVLRPAESGPMVENEAHAASKLTPSSQSGIADDAMLFDKILIASEAHTPTISQEQRLKPTDIGNIKPNLSITNVNLTLRVEELRPPGVLHARDTLLAALALSTSGIRFDPSPLPMGPVTQQELQLPTAQVFCSGQVIANGVAGKVRKVAAWSSLVDAVHGQRTRGWFDNDADAVDAELKLRPLGQ